MKDEVYNRALFRRKSDAARQKLREMGGVDKAPKGIMASSPELMQAAMPPAPVMAPQVTGPRPTMQAPQMRQPQQPVQATPLPNIVPGIFPQMQAPAQQQQPQQPQQTQQYQQRPAPQQPQQQRPAPQQPQQQQQQPVRLAEGGAVAVDVTQAPTPTRGSDAVVNPAEVMASLRERMADNPEAQAAIDELEATVMNPNVPEAERADAAAGAITGSDTREGRAAALSEMTGRETPPNMSVDEINQAIMQVSLGGAIGGPGSVAERISNAMLQGLSAKRETAVKREDEAAALRLARARAAGSGRRSAESGANAWLSSQQGKNAYDLYEKMRQASWSHEDAIEELNKLGGNLGDTLQAAMAPGGAPTPEQGTTSASPAGLTNLMQNAEGVTIGWNGSQWINAQTGEPYSG